MHKLFKRLLVFVTVFSFLEIAGQVPTITSFSPASGPPGTTVVITGTNFSTTAANNIVYFGAARANASVSTATSCTVNVPDGATHESISLSVGIRTAYSKKPFIVTQVCPAPVTAGSFTFSTGSLTGTDESPYYSVLGDFDQDYKTDVALVQSGTDEVSIYRNNSIAGNISMVYDDIESTQGNPRGLATGDLNGDGKLDLVAYNSDVSSISVFRNQSSSGNISFTTATVYDATSVSTTGNGGVSIGDLDGDGKPEIVSANGTGDSVSIWRNLNTTAGSSFAAGSFATPVKYKINTKPCWVHIADIDGDGKADLVTSNESSDNISVLRNQSTSGTISFASPVYFTANNSPDNFAIGDIDQDGKPDVAVVNYASNNICVFRNTSTSGTVSFATRVNFSTPTGPRDLEINDVNGDGWPDISVLTTTTAGISVFENTSVSGTISLATSIDFTLPASSAPRQLSIADIDRDEKPDMLTMSQVTDQLFFERNLIFGQPVMTSASSKTICSGSSVNLSLTATPSSGTTFNWAPSNNPNVSGENPGSSGTINNTLTNTTNVAQTVTYTVNATSSGACSGGTPQPQTVTITINPKPAITAMTNTVCTGTTFTTMPANTTNGIVPSGTTYSWSAPTVTGSMTGGASGSGASSITGVLTNTTTNTQTATYVVTPTANGCSGSAFTLTVSIRPKPTINSSPTETFCSGMQGDLAITSTIPATYSWLTTDNPNTTGESTTAQTGEFINNYIVNTGTAVTTLVYTVTPTSTTGSCTGNAVTATVTVNPQAAITAMTNTVCSTGSFTVTPVHGANGIVPTGTTYSWLSPGVTGGVTNGSGGSGAPNMQGSLINPTTVAQTATYTITPQTGFCVGSTFTLTTTVNPAAAINNMSATACTGTGFTLTPVNATNGIVPPGTTYSWSAPGVTGSMTGGATGSGASSITGVLTNTTSTSQSASYTVTPVSGSCTGSNFVSAITVNPKAVITAMTNTVCTGTTFTLTPVNVTNGVVPSGTTYSWSMPSVTGGMTGGVTGSAATSITGALTNTTSVAQTATYTVTPLSGSCTGSAFTLTVTVNPRAAITAMSNTVCTGTTFTTTPVNATNGTVPSGTTYSWSAPSVTGSMMGGGTGSGAAGITGILTNTTSVAQTATYTITPASGSCSGSNFTLTLTVNPKATITAMTNTVCTATGFTSTPVNVTNGVVPSGTTYSWSAPTVTGSMTGGGTGSNAANITGTLSNTTSVGQTATYTITPGSGSCPGSTFTLTVTVNPKATVSSMTNTACTATGFTTTPVNVTNGVVPSGTTYSWSAPSITGSMTGGGTGSGAGSITGTLTNTTSVSQTATYTVTPLSGTCPGPVFMLTVTVNPKAAITAMTNTVCSGTTFTSTPVNVTNGVVPSGTTYSWSAPAVTGSMTGGATGSNAASITGTLTNTTTIARTATYTVTPLSGSCSAPAFTLVATINPRPVMTSASSKTICSGSPVNLALTSGASATYQWQTGNNLNTLGESTSPQTGSTITNTVTSLSTSIQTLTYTVTPTGTAGSCVGTAQTVTVTLDNIPPIATAGTDSLFCPFNMNLYGNNPSPGSGSWAVQSQSTPTFTVTVFNPSNYNSLFGFNGVVAGDNATMRWTINSQLGVCPATFDDVVFTKGICPLTAAFTTSTNNLCIKPGNTATVTYTDQSVPGSFPITNYAWTFSGGTPSSATGPGPHVVTYTYSAVQTSYPALLNITASNGGGANTSQLITVNPLPSAAGSISGPSIVCQGQNGVSYSVPSIANANSYSWVFPTGAGATNPNNIALTDFSTNAQSGVIKVTGINTCGAGDTSYFPVTANPLPLAAGTISGTSTVCQGQNGINYSVPSITNATAYNWTFPAGGSSSGTGNSVSTNFSTAAVSGLITVTGANACGTGAGSTFSITVNPLPAAAGSINGPGTVCQGQSAVTYSLSPVADATSYSWTLPSGASTASTGNSASIDFGSGATSGLVSVTGVNACGNGTSNTFSVTVNPLPDAAGTISGTTTVCQGQNNVSYSVPGIANATGYSWAFPTGGSSTNPNNIAVTDFDITAQSGLISVAGVNACGAGTNSTYSVTVNPLPGAAGIISGTTPVCQGENSVNYTVPAVTNATGYSWSFPAGISSSGTGTAIQADFSTTAQSGMISVAGVNACGTGTASTFSITVDPLPVAIGTISGSSLVCQGQTSVSYSVSPVANAITYNWTFPSGATSVSTGNSALADFDVSAVSGLITVHAVNACGNGLSNTFSVTVNSLPDAAGIISGPANVCQGQNGVSFSVPSITNASSYNWTLPTGATSVNPNNIALSDFDVTAQSGIVSVAGVNACGTGTSSIFSVTVDPLPGAAGTISGVSPVCQGQSGVTFSVPAITDATSYNWTFPPGISSSGTTAVIIANFGSTAQSGLLSVTGVNSCGTGSSSTYSVTVDPLPAAIGGISGPSSVCEGQSGVNFSVDADANTSAYVWSFPTGASSASTGNSASADFAVSAQSGMITVYGTNACGNGPGNTFSVTVNSLPVAAGTITGPATICAGTTAVNYSVPGIVNATAYNWSFPPGAVSVNPDNTAVTDFDAIAQSGSITVQGVNACGVGAGSTYNVTVDPLPDAATGISGPDSICQGVSGILYSVAPVANATSYSWSSPSGSSGTVTANDFVLDFSASAQSGMISVYAQNACGNGSPATFNLVVNPLPTAPLFSGTLAISSCPLPDSLLFTFAPAANALSYSWILPAGAYDNGNSDNDSVYVGFNSFDPTDTIMAASLNGCGSSAYSQLLLEPLVLTAPEICRVTVDSASNYNEIYWDKTGFAPSDTFLVYRDTANNAYGLIGKVPYDSLSMFIDTLRTLYAANGDPNASSWRYKIAVEDSCGQVSAMSLYHQTLFIQHTLGNFNWSEYEIEGQSTPVSGLINYIFLRDDLSNGNYTTIQVLSASSTAYTDVDYPTYAATAQWRVVTSWTATCYFTARMQGANDEIFGAINTSRSNVRSPTSIGIKDLKEDLNVSIYPVPADESITIETAALSEVNIRMENALGQVVYSATDKQSVHTIDCRKMDAGVYFITLRSEKGQTIRKVIIQ
jgi:hypothetical protein